MFKMAKDQQTWQMFTDYAKSNDGGLVSQIRKSTKDTRSLKKQQPTSQLDDDMPDNEFSVPEKNYLSIIDKNSLRMTDDRIADFRKTLSELVGVKNGIVPPDLQGMLRS